ncbi:type I secretion outer membrane protein, TolC family [Hartmannibacter diazotrophicus]|uniref:Type I secretion outer membrane protein, TolC family n=1 Tax=Hartmannibacter diazotrophicus TaxID=1482074 RepID=A0A2C9D7A3_9HYPH|nr:TolC family outer membrane protein [Hartmannibacter diazotrophicus]SON56177.1 type I secretion outer membrane protein, TolC family [Hartmannibacter diazotrophicus]
MRQITARFDVQLRRFISGTSAAAILVLGLGSGLAHAETLTEALAAAYANNPTLNAARAGTRATDEGVPAAIAGYRPTVSAGATATFQSSRTLESRIGQIALTLTQPIFRGFRTENSVKSAEAAVKASRAALRNTEQTVLLDAVTAYMNLVQDRAIVDLRKSNMTFLSEQVRAANDRFSVGEGTRTDVAQAKAAFASASSALSLAEATVKADEGTYRQVVGHDPKGLSSARAVLQLLPKSYDSALSQARQNHPAISAAVFNSDVAALNVKIIEGELLPTVSLSTSVGRTWASGQTSTNTGTAFSVTGDINIPLYQGGAVYARVRQAKEQYGQAQLQVDSTRDQVQAQLIAAWGTLEAAEAQITAARSQVDAARLALDGVIEEHRVGQRTTLDVLNAQTDLVDAQVSRVQAERDAVVASYAVLSSIGKLSSEDLSLKVTSYKPEVHYTKVRDKWGGLRTPDGR